MCRNMQRGTEGIGFLARVPERRFGTLPKSVGTSISLMNALAHLLRGRGGAQT